MASPAVVAVTESVVATAGTSHLVTLPAGIVATDDVIILMDIGSTSATLNALTGWTELLDEAVANGLKILRYTGAGVPSNPTFVSSAATRSVSLAYRISGASKTTAPQIGTTATGTSTTPNPPSVTPTGGVVKDYLSIAFYGAAGEEADDDTWSDTPPTNYTPSPPRQKAAGTAGTNLGGLIAAAERQITTGAAIDPGTFAKDVSAAWRAQHVLVHPGPPEFVAEQAAEQDLGTDPQIRPAQVISAELAESSQIAQDAVLRAAQRFVTESAAEQDAGQDAVLRTAQSLSVELAAEQDAAGEPILEPTPIVGVSVELGIEQDTAADVVLRAEPVFAAELAIEQYTATDPTMTTARVMLVEVATENDTGTDPLLRTAQRFTVDQATENDTGSELTLGAVAELQVESASESDTALESLLRAEPVFVAELATTSDVASSANLVTDPSVFRAELAVEQDVGRDLVLIGEPPGPWWTPAPRQWTSTIDGDAAPPPYTRTPVQYERIT